MSSRAASPLDRRPLLVGMVHLPPLPGAVGEGRGRRDWLERGVEDAGRLAEAGFDAVLVENHGDAPFFASRVPPETVAALAVVADAVRRAVPPRVAVGVNVLRNDALAALSIAAAAGLDFVRVNVLIGAVVADQGLIEGQAARVLRARERLCPAVRILADARVKHAAPLAPRPLEEEVLDLVLRGGADAVLLSGPRTGVPGDPSDLDRARAVLGSTPVLVGSGATTRTVAALLARADGVVVGTALKRGGRTSAPVDPRRARAFVAAAR